MFAKTLLFLFSAGSHFSAQEVEHGDTTASTSGGGCILPSQPKSGIYEVTYTIDATPGQRLHFAELSVTCRPGYKLVGVDTITCSGGRWSDEMPECLPFCVKEEQTSVVACKANARRCFLEQSASYLRTFLRKSRVGNEFAGMCYSQVYTVGEAVAVDSGASSVDADCGMPTPDYKPFIIGGKTIKGSELPWHTGIYLKTTTPFMQICGGSIVSNKVVVSAAHCFWNDVEKQQPALRFAVGAGKRYRPWNSDQDQYAQKSDVKDIKIPARFQGSTTRFQDDIALVIVKKDFIFNSHVNPVCLDFSYEFDSKQLLDGNLGKVGGWGLTAENGKASPVLKVVELPVVSINRCIAGSMPSFQIYITSDKFCAGYVNGTAVCKGDSGGGLVFADTTEGFPRYFLRGIVSTAPISENLCNAYAWATFTQVAKHEHLIKSLGPEALAQLWPNY